MQSDIISLLEDVLGSSSKTISDEHVFSCAFCHHKKKKLAINLGDHFGAWHCWVCGSSGRSLYSLFKKLNRPREEISRLSKLLQDTDNFTTFHKSNDSDIQLSLPSEYTPLWKPNSRIDYKHALQYTVNRGLTASDILRYQIGYCPEGPYANRVIVPSFDSHGVLNYFVGRSFYEDSTMAYKNPPVSKNVIGFEFYINWSYPVVICEGVYDAMAIKRNAIPLLGKTMPSKLYDRIITNNVSDIYLALDSDALKQTSHMAELFMKNGYRVFVVQLDGKDPGELGFIKMNQLIRQATPLGFAELVKLRTIA